MNNSQYHTIHSVPYHTIQLLLYETSVTRFFVLHSANGIFVYVPNFLRPLLIAPFVDHIHSFRSLFNPSVFVLHLFTAPFRYRHCYAYNRIVDSITSCLLVSWLIERHHMSFDVRITVVCLCMCFYSSPGCIALSCRIIWEYGSHDFFFCTTLSVRIFFTHIILHAPFSFPLTLIILTPFGCCSTLLSLSFSFIPAASLRCNNYCLHKSNRSIWLCNDLSIGELIDWSAPFVCWRWYRCQLFRSLPNPDVSC